MCGPRINPDRNGIRNTGERLLATILFSMTLLNGLAIAAEGTPSQAQALLTMKARVDINKVAVLDATRSGKNLVAVGERSVIFTSDDEGANWVARPVAGEKALTGILAVDDRTLIATGHGGVILRSEDGGSRWDRPSVPTTQKEALLGAISLPGGGALAYGGYASLLESGDGGRNWVQRTILGPDVDKHFYGMASNGESIVLVGESGLIAVSDDGGKQWKAIPSPYPGSLFGVAFMPNGGFIAFGMRGKLLRSKDRGATWSELDSGTSSPFFSATLMRDGSLVVAGKDGVLTRVEADGSRVETRHTQDRRTISRVLQGKGAEWLLFGDAGLRRVQWNDLGK